MNQDPIHLLIAADFSDALLDRIRAVSPRLQVERHFPQVPVGSWERTDILYTIHHLPDPSIATPNLKWVQMHTAGIDHVADHPLIREGAVEVTTTSGIHAVRIAEFCLMLLLTHTYQLPQMLADQRSALWRSDRHVLYAPMALRGRTVGIVGYGAIGRELARQCAALGVRVLALKRDPMHPAERDHYREPGTGDPTGDIPDRIYPPQAVASMIAECDAVVLAAPLTGDSRHLIDAAALAALRPGGLIINVGRGGLIDEAALIAALQRGQISAALDVFDHEPLPASSPLWAMPNVIISPHVSGNSIVYHQQAVDVLIANLTRYLEGRTLLNRVLRDRGY